jgi:hypothetical protein
MSSLNPNWFIRDLAAKLHRVGTELLGEGDAHQPGADARLR